MASACTAGLDTGFVELGYAKVAALGVVQGITELLPISSTAHMRIVPALLGWRDPGSAFSAAMQAAALAAVISYFWKDVRDIVVGSTSAVIRRDFGDWHFRFAIWIVLATLPIVIAGIALSPVLNACNSRRASRRRAITRCSRSSRSGWWTLPAMMRCRCSRTPARRVNMPVCWRSAVITPRAATATARSA